MTDSASFKRPEGSFRLLSHKDIMIAVDTMAAKINEDFENQDTLVLCLLKGGMVFCAQLMTRLSFPIVLDFLRTTRYGDKTTGGQVKWCLESSTPIENRNVLIVDDMIDEGVSLVEAVNYCKTQGARSIHTAVLLDKKHDRKIQPHLKADYTGFEIEDFYVFGFGIDYKHYYRNTLDIFALAENK